MPSTKSTKRSSQMTPDNSKTIFPFQFLPPEIRNKINFYIFKSENEIRIGYYKEKTPTARSTPSEDDSDDEKPKRPTILKGITKITPLKKSGRKVFAVADIHNLNILRVSKAVREEAIKIFYGCNRFVFQTPRAVDDFSSENMEGLGLMKYVEIRDCFGAGSLPLQGLKADRIVLHPEKYANNLWRMIRSFLLFPDGSQQRARLPRSITEEQMKRFDAFFFSIPARAVGVRGSGIPYYRDAQHAHEVLKSRVLEYWKEELRQLNNERSRKTKRRRLAY